MHARLYGRMRSGGGADQQHNTNVCIAFCTTQYISSSIVTLDDEPTTDDEGVRQSRDRRLRRTKYDVRQPLAERRTRGGHPRVRKRDVDEVYRLRLWDDKYRIIIPFVHNGT